MENDANGLPAAVVAASATFPVNDQGRVEQDGGRKIPGQTEQAAPAATAAETAAPAEGAQGAEAASNGTDNATSQSSTADTSAQAPTAVDYDTLVPTITIDHSDDQIPDPVKDPGGYAAFINNDQEQRAKFRNTEINGWKQLESEFPDIKTNPELRQNILARRIFNAQNGQQGGLIEAGRAVLDPLNTARNAGKSDAQVSIETQQAAGLNRATQPNGGQATDTSELYDRFRRGDQQAGQSMVEQMLKDGRL